MSSVAVVIMNWNGRELLEKFLPSVVEHTPPERAEIIVADNGSDDDSIAMLKKKFPSVRRLVLKENLGYAGGYNRAMKEIKAEYAVFLNSDVEVTPGWLDAPLAAMEADPAIACVQPKLIFYHHRDFFEYSGAAGGAIDKYGYPFCRGRIFSSLEEDRGQYDTAVDIFWASGACLFIRTQLFKEVGGFDTTFFMHQEEIDLCWRFKSRGYRVLCVPQSVVYHVGGATLPGKDAMKTLFNFRNNLITLYKNLPEKRLKHVMRVRFWLDYLAAFKFLLTGDYRSAIAIHLAHRAFYLGKPQYEAARRENLAKTTVHTIPEIMQGSILFHYYLLRKRRFSNFRTPDVIKFN
ncbi:MAG: glycosyltransferase family 2 protein [Tannerellaceae bacterium]|jgi:GT2 family glycosyltransferase|nr:glycosyltransferase family 2 protein [Tannerellaceae bacterium]